MLYRVLGKAIRQYNSELKNADLEMNAKFQEKPPFFLVITDNIDV